jgi:hypothetical protein
MDIPSHMTQAVTLLTCIREISGSNLGRDTNYPNKDTGISLLSCVPAGERQDISLKYALQIPCELFII